MRSFPINMALLIFASLLLKAQDNATIDSAPAVKANSQDNTHGKDFTPGFTNKGVVQARSPVLKSDPEQEKAGALGPQLDSEVRSDERAPVDPKEYIVGPVDLLRIGVWHEPELSGQLLVRPDGKISL